MPCSATSRHQLVEHLGWVTAEQSVAGLALAETTPGPLVIVLQFMGFMAGWNQPGGSSPLAAALLAGALAAWATFLPSFVFIFLGAPHVERLTHVPRIAGRAGGDHRGRRRRDRDARVLLAQVVLFPDGWLAWPDCACGRGGRSARGSRWSGSRGRCRPCSACRRASRHMAAQLRLAAPRSWSRERFDRLGARDDFAPELAVDHASDHERRCRGDPVARRERRFLAHRRDVRGIRATGLEPLDVEAEAPRELARTARSPAGSARRNSASRYSQ